MDSELAELSSRLGRALLARGWRLALAESCTGGLLAQVVTAASGCSAWFECGFVSYSNESKVELLGVGPATLARCGAVSEETALEMAAGAIARSHADIAVAVTGIAGPDGGSAAKPVGMVWLAWQQRYGEAHAEVHRFPGDREEVRRNAAVVALERLITLSESSP